MFKLPFLRPHLTGPEGIEGRCKLQGRKEWGSSTWSPDGDVRGDKRKFVHKCCLDGGGGDSALLTKGQSQQAEEILSSPSVPSPQQRYHSVAVYSEVRLTEALKRCDAITRRHLEDADGSQQPCRLRAAVSCKLLEELEGLSGPFRRVLCRIRQELLRAIYSNSYYAEQGDLAYAQMPYFAMAERLEKEKAGLEWERANILADMKQRQEVVLGIEKDVAELRARAQRAEVLNADLERQVAEGQRRREQTTWEADMAKDELRRVRKELARCRDHAETLETSSQQEQTKAEERMHKVQAALEASRKKVAALKSELSTIQASQVDMVPLTELQDLQTRVQDMQSADKKKATSPIFRMAAPMEMESLRKRADAGEKLMGNMTPRPDWAALRPFGKAQAVQMSTEAVVEKLLGYRTQLEELQAQQERHGWLMAPDPAPRSIAKLSATPDVQNGVAEAKLIVPLGTDSSLPRLLRWADPVPLRPMDLDALEARIDQCDAKSGGDGGGTPHLQGYTHHEKKQERGRSDFAQNVFGTWRCCLTGPRCLIRGGLRGILVQIMRAWAKECVATTTDDASLQAFLFHRLREEANADQETGAAAAYNLVFACQMASATSAACSVFLSLLTGQLPGPAWLDHLSMLSQLAWILEEAAGGSGTVSQLEMADLLQHFFCNLPMHETQQLVDAAAADCGCSDQASSHDATATDSAGGSLSFGLDVRLLVGSLAAPAACSASAASASCSDDTEASAQLPGKPGQLGTLVRQRYFDSVRRLSEQARSAVLALAPDVDQDRLSLAAVCLCLEQFCEGGRAEAAAHVRAVSHPRAPWQWVRRLEAHAASGAGPGAGPGATELLDGDRRVFADRLRSHCLLGGPAGLYCMESAQDRLQVLRAQDSGHASAAGPADMA